MPRSEIKVLVGLGPPRVPLCTCPFLHVSAPQGQGEGVAGWGWETEAKVRAEYDLELKVLPQVPASGASNIRRREGVQEG